VTPARARSRKSYIIMVYNPIYTYMDVRPRERPAGSRPRLRGRRRRRRRRSSVSYKIIYILYYCCERVCMRAISIILLSYILLLYYCARLLPINAYVYIHVYNIIRARGGMRLPSANTEAPLQLFRFGP